MLIDICIYIPLNTNILIFDIIQILLIFLTILKILVFAISGIK